MKKILLSILMLLTILSCGNASDNKKDGKDYLLVSLGFNLGRFVGVHFLHLEDANVYKLAYANNKNPDKTLEVKYYTKEECEDKVYNIVNSQKSSEDRIIGGNTYIYDFYMEPFQFYTLLCVKKDMWEKIAFDKSRIDLDKKNEIYVPEKELSYKYIPGKGEVWKYIPGEEILYKDVDDFAEKMKSCGATYFDNENLPVPETPLICDKYSEENPIPVVGEWNIIDFIEKQNYNNLYTMVEFPSDGFAVRGGSWTKLAYGSADEEKGEMAKYSLDDCLQKLENKLQDYRENQNAGYRTNGIYDTNQGFVRMICMKSKDLEDSFVKDTFFNVDYDKFFNKYEDKFPRELNMDDFDKYTILPFENDEKLARKYSDKLNDYMKKMENAVYKTSFDCSLRNLSDREEIVCHNKRLADKDIELNTLYKKVISKYNDTEYLQQIKSSQRKWIKSLSSSRAYLSMEYTDRIKYLQCLIEKDFNECKY